MGSTDARRELFQRLIAGYLGRVFNFAFRMTLDRARARQVVEETYLRAYLAADLPTEAQEEAWLLRIAHHILDQALPRTPEVSWDLLDDTLRSEATRTDAVHSLLDPQRDFLLWELKQGCMTSVVNCLSPGERAAFVLATVLRLPEEAASRVLGISAAAFKVRLSRARKKVADYLAPRCEHVDPRNPCHCPSRIGVAVRSGFIPVAGEVSLRKAPQPFGRYGAGPGQEDEPLRDIVAIYGNLPEPDSDIDLRGQLEQQLASGAWDRARDRKGAS